MAIEFTSRDKLPKGAATKERFIPIKWFTEEFKEALKENPGKFGLMNDGQEVDRSYFLSKIRKQAVAASKALGGKVVLHFEPVEKAPKENHVISRGPNKGKKTTVYYDQGKVRAALIEGESYAEGTDFAEVVDNA